MKEKSTKINEIVKKLAVDFPKGYIWNNRELLQEINKGLSRGISMGQLNVFLASYIRGVRLFKNKMHRSSNTQYILVLSKPRVKHAKKEITEGLQDL